MAEEFEVLETLFFERPPEWGRRIVKKADGEIMMQSTENKGHTWVDAPIPDAKLTLSAKTRTASSTGNSYAGLVITPRDEAMTRAVSASEKELNPTVTEAIESGQLLTKTTEATDGNEIETITFLGTFAASGLPSGTVWRDSSNYLRIVP